MSTLTAPQTFIVATTTPPTIVCPSWCEETQEAHLAGLDNLEGKVVHYATGRLGNLSTFTLPDGTPAGNPTIALDGSNEEITPDQARDLAAWLLRTADVIEE